MHPDGRTVTRWLSSAAPRLADRASPRHRDSHGSDGGEDCQGDHATPGVRGLTWEHLLPPPCPVATLRLMSAARHGVERPPRGTGSLRTLGTIARRDNGRRAERENVRRELAGRPIDGVPVARSTPNESITGAGGIGDRRGRVVTLDNSGPLPDIWPCTGWPGGGAPSGSQD